jgi:hypothetical protein
MKAGHRQFPEVVFPGPTFQIIVEDSMKSPQTAVLSAEVDWTSTYVGPIILHLRNHFCVHSL